MQYAKTLMFVCMTVGFINTDCITPYAYELLRHDRLIDLSKYGSVLSAMIFTFLIASVR